MRRLDDAPLRFVWVFLFTFWVCCLVISLSTRTPKAQPSAPPPIVWDAAADTLTITRADVMVCIPQAHDGKPSCRFAKWWTETVIR